VQVFQRGLALASVLRGVSSLSEGIKDCFGGERGGGMFSQELRSCSAP